MPDAAPVFSVHVRGMVCDRCVLVARQCAEATGTPVAGVRMGRIDFAAVLPDDAVAQLERALEGVGFGIIRARDELLAERLDLALRALAGRTPAPARTELTAALATELTEPLDWSAAALQRRRGTTPTQRYEELLMARAERLLREGELQVGEVAHALGYAHLSGFSRAFKRTHGVSPSEWGP